MKDVPFPDGSVVRFHAVGRDYDPTDKDQVLATLHRSRDGEGVPDRDPLPRAGEAELCPEPAQHRRGAADDPGRGPSPPVPRGARGDSGAIPVTAGAPPADNRRHESTTCEAPLRHRSARSGSVATGCASSATVVPGRTLALASVEYPEGFRRPSSLQAGEEPPTARFAQSFLRELGKEKRYEVVDARNRGATSADLGKDSGEGPRPSAATSRPTPTSPSASSAARPADAARRSTGAARSRSPSTSSAASAPPR